MTKTETAKNLLKRVFIKTKYSEYYEIDGKFDGEYKRWYENGQLEEHCYYKNGKLDGEYTSWHQNGRPLQHSHYTNGLYDGKYKKMV